jgi:osmotically-inducible protein OsmY
LSRRRCYHLSLSDAQLAKAAINAFSHTVAVPKDKITVKAETGWLTLEGQVDWQFERDAAFLAGQFLPSVIGVSNAITLKPAVVVSDVKGKIREAFERAAEIDANKLEVDASDGAVTLHGEVHSWTEHEQETHAAYCVPGVRFVRNKTTVV